MNLKTLTDFAIFNYSRKARKQVREYDQPSASSSSVSCNVHDYLSGQIGEFGVGSSQAAFFNSRILSVMTGQESNPNVTYELEIDADHLAELEEAKEKETWKANTNARPRGKSQLSKLNPTLVHRREINKLIQMEANPNMKQFTRIFLSKLKPNNRKLIQLNLDSILHELIRIYQYYLFGLNGLPSFDPSADESDVDAFFRQCDQLMDDRACLISFRYCVNDAMKYDFPDLRRIIFDVPPTPSIAFMRMRQGAPFQFRGQILRDGQEVNFQGSIWYYPFVDSAETHPEYKMLEDRAKEIVRRHGLDDTNSTTSFSVNGRRKGPPLVIHPAPIFELTWHGRVIPGSTCQSIEWIDAACSKRFAQCRYRLKGNIR